MVCLQVEALEDPRVLFRLALTWAFSEPLIFCFFFFPHPRNLFCGCAYEVGTSWQVLKPVVSTDRASEQSTSHACIPVMASFFTTFVDQSAHSQDVCCIRVWLRALLSLLRKCPAGLYWPCNASYRHVLEINHVLLEYCVSPLLLYKCPRHKANAPVCVRTWKWSPVDFHWQH